MKPPGSANALTAGSSTTRNVHGSPGRSEVAARRVPSAWMYVCNAGSEYSPMDETTSWSYCRPISISCDSLTSISSRSPVAGFTAHPASSTARARLADELAAVTFGRRLLVRVRRDLEPAVQRQLLQNVVHVTLYGVRRDVEALGDFLVAEPLGDEIGDLLLPLGHADRRHHRGVAQHGPLLGDVREQGPRQRGRDDVAAVGDLADGVDEIFERGILRDETVGTALDEIDDVFFFRQHVHHDDARVRRRFLDALDQTLAAVPPQRGVYQHDVGPGLLQPLQRRRPTLGACHHFEFGLRIEERRETITQQ